MNTVAYKKVFSRCQLDSLPRMFLMFSTISLLNIPSANKYLGSTPRITFIWGESCVSRKGKRKKVHVHLFFQVVLSLEDAVHTCWAHAWCKVIPQVPTSEGNGQEQLYTCSVFAFGATDSLVGRLQWLCALLRPSQCVGCDLLTLWLFQSYTH